MQEIERWIEIKGCSGYFISNHGNVIGRRGRKIKIQKYKSHGGYYFFRMPHMKYNRTIHRIVAEHFIENPNNLPEVNHKNGLKSDNSDVNLEWVTRKQNMQHAHRTGLRVNTGWSKMFDDVQANIIFECFDKKFTNVSIAKYFNCDQSTIAYIRQGKRQYYVR